MRKPQLLIMIVVSSLLGSILLGSYPWQEFSIQAEPASNQEPQPSSTSTPSTDASEQLELTPEQIEQLSEQLANELAKPEPPQYKLCADSSDGYLKFPLKEVDPIFRSCADDLLKLTQVPLVLPAIAPTTFEGEKLYAFFYIPLTNANHYYIGLTWKPGEYYQANRAWFEGEKLTPQSPTLAAFYEKESAFARSSPRQKALSSVHLSDGIQGYYIPAVCGINCLSAYGSILWDQEGYRYSIGIKMAEKAEVLEVVNAAIKNRRIK